MDGLVQFLVGVLIALFAFFGIGTPADVPRDTAEPLVEQATVVAVYDGDTILVELSDGSREEVRYIGIDTPERGDLRECYVEEATAKNIELVQGEDVTLVADTEDRDTYGRLLRYVYVDDVFVNEVLVEEGYATALTIPPNTQHADVFAASSERAEASGTGLWSVCD